MIPWHNLGLREIVYTHRDPQSGVETTWAIGRLSTAALALPIVEIPVDHVFAEAIRRIRGLEAHRMARLTEVIVRTNPILLADMGDGTHNIIDGNHRYIKAHDLGHDWIAARLVPLDLSLEYQIEGLPELGSDAKVRGGFSGIL